MQSRDMVYGGIAQSGRALNQEVGLETAIL